MQIPKLDGRTKKVFGVVMLIGAAIGALVDEYTKQSMEDEVEELKAKVAKLEGKES